MLLRVHILPVKMLYQGMTKIGCLGLLGTSHLKSEAAKKRVKKEKVIPMFRLQENQPLYHEKFCMWWTPVSTILKIAKDVKLGAPAEPAKTMSRLSN